MSLKYFMLIVCSGAMTSCTIFPTDPNSHLTIEQYRAKLIAEENVKQYGNYATIDEQISKENQPFVFSKDMRNARKGTRDFLIVENLDKLYEQNHTKMDEIYAENKNKAEIVCNDPKIEYYKTNAKNRIVKEVYETIHYNNSNQFIINNNFNTFIPLKAEFTDITQYQNDKTYVVENIKLVEGTCVNNVLDTSAPIEFFVTLDRIKVQLYPLQSYKKQYNFLNRYTTRRDSSFLLRMQNGVAIDRLTFNRTKQRFQLVENFKSKDKIMPDVNNNILIDDNNLNFKENTYTYYIDDGFATRFDLEGFKLLSSVKEPKQIRKDLEQNGLTMVLKLNDEEIQNNHVEGRNLGTAKDYENAYFYRDDLNNRQNLYYFFKLNTDGTPIAHGMYNKYENGKKNFSRCALNGLEQTLLSFGYCRFFTKEDTDFLRAANDENERKIREKARIEYQEHQEWLRKERDREAENRLAASRSLAYEINKTTRNFQQGINSMNAQTAYTNQLIAAANRENMRKAYPPSSGASYSSNSNSSSNTYTSSSSSSSSTSSEAEIAQKKRDEAKKIAEHEKKQKEEQLAAVQLAKEKEQQDYRKAEQERLDAEERARERKQATIKAEQARKQKLEQEARDKNLKEQLFLQEVVNTTRLSAKKCPDGEGNYYVVGTRPRNNSQPINCVDIHYRASCPGSSHSVTGIGRNFTGMSTGCFSGDTYKISEKLSCDVEKVIVKTIKATKCS